jgi:hypothetical protein
MDYRKIDAPLAAALEATPDAGQSLTIFISTTGESTPTRIQFLTEHGIDPEAARRAIFSATVSAKTVAELSDQPWVSALRLSQKLRPIDG